MSFDGDFCPRGRCDGSGWILDEDADLARPCECREIRINRASSRRIGSGIPRRVVPIWSFPSLLSPAWSSIRWYGMITWALAETFSPLVSTPRLWSPTISSASTFGSTTTPLPMMHFLPGCRIPEGIRCSANFSPSRTIVWPALLPPW